MRIAHKLIAVTLLLSSLIWIVGLQAVSAGKASLESAIQESAGLRAAETMEDIDRSLHAVVDEWRTYVASSLVQRTVAQANARAAQSPDIRGTIRARDREWTAAGDTVTPMMRRLLDTDLSADMHARIRAASRHRGFVVFGEVLVTNRYGANVAQTHKTSDYRQDDEAWWQRAVARGVYVSDVQYDDSAGMYAVDVCVRIDDEQGDFIGVLKAVYNIEGVITRLRSMGGRSEDSHPDLDHQDRLTLLTADGRIIYRSGEDHTPLTQCAADLLGGPNDDRRGPVSAFHHNDEQLGDMLAGRALSQGYDECPGHGWSLVIEHPAKELFAPVIRLRNNILIISLAVTVVSVGLGLVLSLSLSRRVRCLRNAARLIGGGDFAVRVDSRSADEVGQLGGCFNDMAAQLEANVAQIRAQSESIVRRNAVLKRQVAERRRAEREQRAYAGKLARSNQELEQFASIASHDLQEPLRKIRAFGDRLRARCGDQLSEQGNDYLDRMQNAAGRMASLITELLTYSRVTTQAKSFQPVDLNELAAEVISDLEIRIEEQGGQVEVGPLPTIDADALQMRQLFQNILGNALKFSKPGRPPHVRVDVEDGEEGTCRIIFRDNGIGFAPAYADRIFGVFQRLHGRGEYEGTGMGLAIVRKIVDRHNGAIRAESQPGEGATFVLTIPLGQPKTEDSAHEQSRIDDHPDGGRRRGRSDAEQRGDGRSPAQQPDGLRHRWRRADGLPASPRGV